MRIFIAMLAFAGLFANASDMKDAAYKAVENSRAQLEDFRKSRVEKISQKKSELDALSKEIKELRELEETLTASIAERASLSSAAAFCDSRAGELAADMRDFRTSFFPELQAVAARSSASESLEIIRREGDSWLKSLFNPLEPRPFAAVPISSREKVDGKIFRVGAFAYFISPERAGFMDSEGVLYGENFARDIRDFAGGKKNSLPADISAGTIFSAEKNARSIAEEISLGGIWMYPILLLGFLSALVFLIKLAYFMRIRRAPEGVAGKIKQALAKGGESAALGIAAASGYPYSRLLADLIESRNLSQAALEEVSYESMLSAGEKLFSGLSVLSVSAAVAPLLGLLGTVTGIIKTFGDLSFSGAGQAEFISAGISEALITTEYGLVVAIPAYVAHAIFSRRAKSVLSDMEKIASSYLSGN